MTRERPILFSAPMVRALLAGKKTQTRRVLTTGTNMSCAELAATQTCKYGVPGDRLWVRETWTPADEMATGYAKEEPEAVAFHADLSARNYAGVHQGEKPYSLSTGAWNWDRMKWKPSIFMPRWASRITLEVTGVRVERVQDISEEDARAEGLAALSKDGGETVKYGIPDRDGLPGTDDDGWEWRQWSRDPRQAYAYLWSLINDGRPGCAWADNPFVWAVSFRVVSR